MRGIDGIDALFFNVAVQPEVVAEQADDLLAGVDDELPQVILEVLQELFKNDLGDRGVQRRILDLLRPYRSFKDLGDRAFLDQMMS